MRKLFLSLIFLCFAAGHLMATHNRAGEIVYRKLPGNTFRYEITIITYSDITSSAYRDSLTLKIYYCPDGTVPLDTIVIQKSSVQGIVGDVVRTEYRLDSYTFPGPGCYRLAMFDPNRVAGIKNISASVEVPFYIEDTLRIVDPQFFGFNSSPILLEHPIVFAAQYHPFRHNPGAYDPDGDSMVFTLITPLQDQGLPVPYLGLPDDPLFTNAGVPYPNVFKLDRFTGEITWDVPHQKGTYNIAILIREFRDGLYLGSIIRDMQIWVGDSSNLPPEVSDLDDRCAIAGEEIRQSVFANDPGDRIQEFTAVGGPFAVKSSPATWVSDAPRFSPATGIFNWQTNCSHIRRSKYITVFTARDDYKVNNLQSNYSDAETWLIEIVGPAPKNLEARIDQPNKRIEVRWDSLYACDGGAFENFIGFTVWRKRGCDSTDITECAPARLAQRGYQRISKAKPFKGYHYYDKTAKVGVVYSYRVQAEFAEQVPNSEFFYNQVASQPSNAACAQLKSDVPVITNVDVRSTDPSLGNIMVRWYPPDEEALDTFKNPGPYRYELFAHEGLSTGSGTVLLNTYSFNSFSALHPDSFLHQNINTRGLAHSYSIRFYATDPANGEYEVGEAEGASSVFLKTTASNKQIYLQWDEQVPWNNFYYEVYRLHPDSSSYELYGSTTSKEFVDAGLSNLLQYCYFVRSYGSYYNARLPDTLINNSQIICDIPRDTVPPCAPKLSVSNSCDDGSLPDPENLVNHLQWTDPRTVCGDFDLEGYRIYFAASEQDTLKMILEIPDPDVHAYDHADLQALAGCYVVTAYDTFGNESSRSAKVCLDNCPLYRLPNTFTPNGDGDNDLFTPILPYFFIDHINIRIFNRWGVLVFETSDPMINWDGRNMKNGKEVEEGTYHYVCEVYESRVAGVVKVSKPLSGYIQIIR